MSTLGFGCRYYLMHHYNFCGSPFHYIYSIRFASLELQDFVSFNIFEIRLFLEAGDLLLPASSINWRQKQAPTVSQNLRLTNIMHCRLCRNKIALKRDWSLWKGAKTFIDVQKLHLVYHLSLKIVS